MSSVRGTIKAGTFGGRRYREKVKRTEQQNVAREKAILKARKGQASSLKVIDEFKPSYIPKHVADARDFQLGHVYGRSSSAVLQKPLGRGGEQPSIQGAPSRAREIQLAVNTMPLKQDIGFLKLVRQEQQERENEMNGIIDGEEDFGDDMDMHQDFREELHAEAGQVDEEGNVEYGTAPLPQPQDASDIMPDWMGDPVSAEGGFGEMTLGDGELDLLAGLGNAMADMDVGEAGIDATDMDDIADQLAGMTAGDALGVPAEVAPEKSLVEELEARRAARQDKAREFRDLSIPPGDMPHGGMFIGSLGPSAKLDPANIKYPLDYYKRTKPTKKNPQGDLKISTKKTLTGQPTLMPTEELKALEEGRILDLRPGHIGSDVAANVPELGHKGGKRSRAKEADIRGVMGIQHGKKSVRELGEGVVRDPKTRKIKLDAQGQPLMEQKRLTITGRQKGIDEVWGLDKKGMSREPENLPLRDPWEGSRVIGKGPGKQATRAKEAETKHALYVKGEREKDPEYLPRGYDRFSYGAGKSDWDEKVVKQPLGLGSRQSSNIVQKTSEDFRQVGGPYAEAGYRAMGLVASTTPQVPKSVINPPMANLQATARRSIGWKPDPQGVWNLDEEASAIANMSDAELERRYGDDELSGLGTAMADWGGIQGDTEWMDEDL